MNNRHSVSLLALSALAILASCVTTRDGTNTSTRVAGVRFVSLQDELTPEAQDTLARVVDELNAHPEAPITITGHAYDATSTAHNMARSKARGEAVASFLEAKGIDRARITLDSRGDTDPPIPIQDLAARKRGNRAEIYMCATP